MVTLTGTLLVNNTERDGEIIKLGLLECDLGRFQVSYPHLESLEEGRHQGFFNVSSIEQHCYSEQGKFSFELIALIKTLAFCPNEATAQEISASDELVEQDEENEPEIFNQTSDQIESEPLEDLDEHDDSDNEDAELFGRLFPLKDKVKLDASEPRDRLNRQVERLRSLSYRFYAKQQVWYSPSAYSKQVNELAREN